ncbi:MAG: alpha/beta fold hydrolase BchO [Pseudomonadota bacterium]
MTQTGRPRVADRPDWATDGGDWPNRAWSTFVDVSGFRWHIQRAGDAGQAKLLMLHGTGAATHSWAGLLPLLAAHYDVLAVDLPGHGFTADPGSRNLSLNGMSALINRLLDQLDFAPAYVVGHSAGAALGVRMTLDERIAPGAIASINGAFLPFPGVARSIFPSLARILFLNPLTPQVFAWRARQQTSVDKLLKSTGSDLTPEQVAPYAMLMGYAGHISGALGMMANWDLATLERDLPKLTVPLLLIAAVNDKTVPAADAEVVARQVPPASVRRLSDVGHLAHEEAPGRVADLIFEAFGTVPSSSA